MTRRAIALALPALLPLLAAAPAPPRGALRWPLGVPGVLLSGFGEYRYDHLHAGIDISTSGGTGHRVLAAAAGSVYRLKVEWRGYGRAAYVRHPDGRITVYGHLERFEDATLGLEKRVARRQAEAGTRYPGDLYLDPPVPVRRGQVIGFSGESGVGLPHLHFEVRRGEETPVDPFTAGLPRPADRRAPILEEILVTAAREDVFVEGTRREVAYPFRRREGRYSAGPVRVGGPFLLALVAHDPAGAGGGRSGLRSVRAVVDGTPAYELVMRAFRFEQYPQAGLLYDHRASRLGPARYAYRLARLPGNDLAAPLPARPAAAGLHPGAFDLTPGPHLLEIAAEDSAGNRSRARVCVLVGAPPAPAVLEDAAEGNGGAGVRFAVGADASLPPDAPADGACRVPDRRVEGAAWNPESGEFRPIPCHIAEGVCRPDQAGVVAARLREVRHGVPGPWAVASLPAGRSGRRAGELRVEAWPAFLDVLAPLAEPLPPDAALVAWSGDAAVAPLAYRDGLTAGAGVGWARLAAAGPLALAPEGRRLTGLVPDVRLARPGEETLYRGPGFTIVIPPGGRFFPGPLAVRTEHVPGSPSLPALSEAVDLLPAGEALRERGVLRFELTGALPDARALGIYRWNAERERWTYEGGEVESGGGAMTLRFRRYGRFALLQDASPPVVAGVEPRDGAVVGRRPRIAARVEEEGEGLGFDGVAFELDGLPLEAEFDPDRARATVLSLPPLRPGPHRLRVVATDAAGNASDPVTASFTVR